MMSVKLEFGWQAVNYLCTSPWIRTLRSNGNCSICTVRTTSTSYWSWQVDLRENPIAETFLSWVLLLVRGWKICTDFVNTVHSTDSGGSHEADYSVVITQEFGGKIKCFVILVEIFPFSEFSSIQSPQWRGKLNSTFKMRRNLFTDH